MLLPSPHSSSQFCCNLYCENTNLSQLIDILGSNSIYEHNIHFTFAYVQVHLQETLAEYWNCTQVNRITSVYTKCIHLFISRDFSHHVLGATLIYTWPVSFQIIFHRFTRWKIFPSNLGPDAIFLESYFHKQTWGLFKSKVPLILAFIYF